MKKAEPCDKCGRSFTEHTISNAGGSLHWVCPNLKKGTE